MRYGRMFVPIVVMAMAAGCATLPAGPAVEVLPARGKSFETFRSEDASCRQWAQQQVGSSVQETYQRDVTTGAVGGTAIGAGVGALFGSASGHAGAGAAIGAATGLLAGSVIGSGAGEATASEAQRRYDNAYVQCMYSHGNQVPGYRPASAPPPVAATPPPAPAPPLVAAPEPEYAAPELDLAEAPQFIYAPELNMYVAVGVPYDLVYSGRDYYCFYRGRWFRGPYYNGPWEYVPRRSYPTVFLRFRIGDFRHYRDREYRRYEDEGEHYRGRFYRPEYRREWRGRGREDD